MNEYKTFLSTLADCRINEVPPNLKEGIKKGKEHLWYDRHVPYFIHGHTDWGVPDTGPVV